MEHIENKNVDLPHYHYYICRLSYNLMFQGNDPLDEIAVVVAQGAPTMKCYMTYRDDGLYVSLEDMGRIARRLHEAKGMLLVHAEDDEIITRNVAELINTGLTDPVYHARSKPPESEDNAVSQCIEIARETGCRLFVVHATSPAGIELINKARGEGVDIIAETCTHYLVFTKEMLSRSDGIKWICSPPLRSKEHCAKLWEFLRDGSLSMVTSDDAAFS